LHVLHGLLDGAHGGVQFANIVAGLLDKSLQDRMVLRNLRGHVLLTLQKRGDVSLQVDDFAGHGFRGAWPDEAPAERPGKNGGGKK